jgi:hypothetical protein
MEAMMDACIRIFVIIISLAFGFFGNAVETNAKKDDPSSVRFKIYIEGISSIDSILFPMALGDASIPEINKIYNDIRSRADIKKMPKFRLRENQVLINERPTGIQLAFGVELVVKYGSSSWKYDKDASLVENYVSLQKTLNIEPAWAFRSFLLESAFADGDQGDRIIFSGALAGYKMCNALGNGNGGVLCNLISIPIAAVGGLQIHCNSRNEASYTEGYPQKAPSPLPEANSLCPRSDVTSKTEAAFNKAISAMRSAKNMVGKSITLPVPAAAEH